MFVDAHERFNHLRLKNSLLHLWVVLLSVFSVPNAAGAESQLQVGLAKVDITPTYPVRLSGFGSRREESTQVRQTIWAKAIAFRSEEEKPAILVSVDSCGVPRQMTDRLAAALAGEGVTPERLVVVATHTHSAPMLSGVLSTLFGEPIPPQHQANIERYTKELAQKLEQVAKEALRDCRPARLEWGVGKVEFATNRRTKGGPVDHTLPLLVAKSMEGTIRGLVFNYACHCVTLSDNKINGDWAGYAQAALERQFPDAVALTTIGCGADQNPNSGVTGDREDIAAQQGSDIAAEVGRLLKTELQELSARIEAKYAKFDLPLQPVPEKSFWEAQAKAGGAVGYHAQVQLQRLNANQELPAAVPYSVQTWSFGDDLAMVFLPGEVVVDYALRLKNELDQNRLWVTAYANDCPCYIPSERILKEGGYEGGGAMTYYDLPASLAPGLEDEIVLAVHEQVGQSFKKPLDGTGTHGSLPLSPEESIGRMQLKPGFVAEVVAAEPHIVDPVAVDFGIHGELWVAEMHDYPTGIHGDYAAGGRVKLLRDHDGDGRFEAATVFLEDLPFPTGVTTWRKGMLVCAAPDIIYAEDTDGDGRADIREVLFTGFATENYQARVNSLRYGLDGWVYGSAGLLGGEITSTKTGIKVPLGSRDFRINPDLGVLEPVSGRTQQGRDRDDWGNWFGCENGVLLRHYPLDEALLARNPYLQPPAASIYVPAYENSNQLFPISELVTFELSGPPGRATAACGLGIYRDSLFGPSYSNNAFVCEPVNQVVHRLVVQPNGVTFTGQRAEDEKDREFLASSDSWFRPVEVRTGPDGALWVVDMYRYVIEHPRWIPESSLKQLNLRAGDTLGRIYRIAPAETEQRTWPRIAELETKELVELLASDNGWLRDIAQQVIVWQQRTDASELLRNQVQQSVSPLGRLHALATLAQLDCLEQGDLLHALRDPDIHVRRHAVRFAMPVSEQSEEVREKVRALGTDQDQGVQLQVSYALHDDHSAKAAAELVRLAKQHGKDPYMTAAILSSVNKANIRQVAMQLFQSVNVEQATDTFVAEVTRMAGAYNNSDAVAAIAMQLSETLEKGNHQQAFALLPHLLDGLQASAAGRLSGTGNQHIENALAAAREFVADDENSDEQVLQAVTVLGRLPQFAEADSATLSELLSPARSMQLQLAALEALDRINTPTAVETMLEYLPRATPGFRARVVSTLLARPASHQRLLEHFDEINGALPLDAQQRELLLTSSDRKVQTLAQKILHVGNSDRSAIVQQYRNAVNQSGDVQEGAKVFARACSACHRLGDVGHVVGPDLAALTDRSVPALIESILDPHRKVEERYISYAVRTVDGKTVTGLLAEETATTVTLRAQEGVNSTVLREEIDEFQAMGKSLMPDGLERDINPDEMNNLVAFLAQKIGPAGDSKHVVEPAADGIVVLTSRGATIHGGDIAYDEPYDTIGFWHGQHDTASWRVQLKAPGKYRVLLDYSCADESAGNKYIVTGGTPELKGTIAGTGGWQSFREIDLGATELPAGTTEIVVRPDGPLVQRALLDLRTLKLVPVNSDGSKFQEVAPAEDGSITLTARGATIRGGDIAYDEPYDTIGFWHGQHDTASWRVRLEKAATYQVLLDYSCAEYSAGNKFIVTGGMPELKGTVASTGGWQSFRVITLGRIKLAAGTSEIAFRPDGPLSRPALLDLRTLRLLPVDESVDIMATIKPMSDGNVILTARGAIIRGGDIAYDEPYDTVGFWHDEHDIAMWRVQLEKAGTYKVFLDYSCADDCAGNPYVVTGGKPDLKGTVASTGGWQSFNDIDLGRIELPAGTSDIVFRPDGPLKTRALLDIRTLRLVPVAE